MSNMAHFPTFQRLRLFDVLRLVSFGAAVGIPCAALFMAAATLAYPEMLFAFDVDWNGVLPSQIDLFWRACGESLSGALVGGAIALAFTTFAALVTRGRFDWRMVTPFLRKMPRLVLASWLTSGLLALSWGLLILVLTPHWLNARFTLPMALRALWAVGSRFGALIGCGLALLLGCVQFHRELKARKKAKDAAELLMSIRAASN
jgi:hypothetical protein